MRLSPILTCSYYPDAPSIKTSSLAQGPQSGENSWRETLSGPGGAHQALERQVEAQGIVMVDLVQQPAFVGPDESGPLQGPRLVQNVQGG